MPPILEGKEVDQKLGSVGALTVDVQPNGHIDLAMNLSVSKEIIPGLSVFHSSQSGAQVKLATLAAAQAAKSDNKIIKYIADVLAKLDAGDEVHPELVALADAHAEEVKA